MLTSGANEWAYFPPITQFFYSLNLDLPSYNATHSVQISPGNLSVALRELGLREMAQEHVDTLATVVAVSFNEVLCL